MIITVSRWNLLAFKEGSEVLVFAQGDTALVGTPVSCPTVQMHMHLAQRAEYLACLPMRRELNRVTWSPQPFTA